MELPQSRLVLVTTQIIYYRPDYRSLLNSFVWQCDDRVPGLPRVSYFLEHWRREIDAVIADVAVAYSDSRGEWRRIDEHIKW